MLVVCPEDSLSHSQKRAAALSDRLERALLTLLASEREREGGLAPQRCGGSGHEMVWLRAVIRLALRARDRRVIGCVVSVGLPEFLGVLFVLFVLSNGSLGLDSDTGRYFTNNFDWVINSHIPLK